MGEEADSGTPWRTLREVTVQMRAGGTPKRGEPSYWGGDIPFVKIEDLTSASNGRIRSASEGITAEGLQNSSARVINPGSVLLSMYASIGTVAINDVPVATNQAIIALEPDRRVLDADYLAYTLRMLAPRLQAMNVQTTQKNVNGGIVASFSIPVPPLAEQTRVANALSAVELAAESTSAEVRAAEAVQQSLVRELLLPRGDWHEVALGEAATLQRGRDLPKANRRPGSIPVFGSNGKVGEHADSMHPGPGVLVGRSGSVGQVVWSPGPFWALNTALWVRDFHGNDARFIFYLLESLPLARFATGVSVPTLNRNLVHPIRVHLPDLPTQKRISEHLDVAGGFVSALRHSSAARRSVLHAVTAHLFKDIL